MIERRRLLLMRHGAVDYFDRDGRPYAPDAVPLTPDGIDQARAMGAALAAAGVRIDRAVTSGLTRTRQTAENVLAAAGTAPPIEHWPELQEIRGGHLPSIPDAELRAAFIGAFEGPVPRETRFLQGETIGALLDRTLPALQRLLAAKDWDTALMVLHGGVNRGLLSWFLTGEAVFLGGLAQDTGCLNIIDVGNGPATSVVRVVNFCPIDTLQTTTRLSTMEHLLEKYLRLRERRGDLGELA
ncbi:MAG TPA: histidine phosphatase family protein [Burkholderiaceae bacterium]|nr:histidine phosphatase family protein [Burkholderiaceae bacterium]HQR72441.1 histidine phosphatase family protein [Burkholderiaceae bacterium]